MKVKDSCRRVGDQLIVHFAATGIYRRVNAIANDFADFAPHGFKLREFVLSGGHDGAEIENEVRVWGIFTSSGTLIDAFPSPELQAAAFQKIISSVKPFYKRGPGGMLRSIVDCLKSFGLPIIWVLLGVGLAFAGLAMIGAGQTAVKTDDSAALMLQGKLPAMPSPVSPFAGMMPVQPVADRIAPDFVDAKKIPLERTILVGTKGKPRLFVFSDPRCEYCVQLEKEVLPGLVNDYEVRMVPVPIQGPESATLIAQAFCAKDPRVGWSRTVRGEEVELGTLDKGELTACVHKAIENYNMSKELGVLGTPALVTVKGRAIGGFVPLPEMKKFLSLADN